MLERSLDEAACLFGTVKLLTDGRRGSDAGVPESALLGRIPAWHGPCSSPGPMADETETEPEVAPSGGKNKLMIILVVTNLVAVIGAAVAIVFATSTPASGDEEEAEAEESTELGPLVELAAMVVNLDEPGGTHYLRAGFQLEITDGERQPEVEARMVPIRSAVMLHLSGLSSETTTGQEARETILEQIATLCNEQIGSELVRRAYFTEFVVQ